MRFASTGVLLITLMVLSGCQGIQIHPQQKHEDDSKPLKNQGIDYRSPILYVLNDVYHHITNTCHRVYSYLTLAPKKLPEGFHAPLLESGLWADLKREFGKVSKKDKESQKEHDKSKDVGPNSGNAVQKDTGAPSGDSDAKDKDDHKNGSGATDGHANVVEAKIVGPGGIQEKIDDNGKKGGDGEKKDDKKESSDGDKKKESKAQVNESSISGNNVLKELEKQEKADNKERTEKASKKLEEKKKENEEKAKETEEKKKKDDEEEKKKGEENKKKEEEEKKKNEEKKKEEEDKKKQEEEKKKSEDEKNKTNLPNQQKVEEQKKDNHMFDSTKPNQYNYEAKNHDQNGQPSEVKDHGVDTHQGQVIDDTSQNRLI